MILTPPPKSMNDQPITAMTDSVADTSTDTPMPAFNTDTTCSSPSTSATDLLVPSDGTTNVGSALLSSPVLNAITPNAGIEVVKGIEMTSLGLKVEEGVSISPAQFNTLLCSVTALNRASNWLLGDTMDIADRTWGNKATGSKYEEVSKQTGMSISTLKHIASICHNIPYENRRATLSFTHHLEAHNLTDSVSEREAALDRACEEHTSVKALRTELRQQRAEKLQASGEAVQGRDIVDELCSEEAQEAVAFPCSYELLKFNYWLQKQNLWKLDDDVRVRIIEAAAPLMTRLYTLMQLELEENPDAEFDVPFSIQPRDFDTNTPL